MAGGRANGRREGLKRYGETCYDVIRTVFS